MKAEDSWFNDQDDKEADADPGAQLDKARLYLDMGLTEQELRESMQIKQKYIDMAKQQLGMK